jgi:hypothetical protein
MVWIYVFSSISVYGKPYLDEETKRYWSRNTDYSENPDSKIDLDLLQLWPLKRFLWTTCEYESCRKLPRISKKYKNPRIWVRMREIWSKYWTGQRQFRTRWDDVTQKDLISRCNTETKLKTRPKPAIWLWLRHELNKTNLKINFAKAQRV